MTKQSNYPDYVITSTSDIASHIAETHELGDSWLRLPPTLESEPEVFVKTSTPILSKEEWRAFSAEEYDKNSLSHSPNSRILFAKDFAEASRYAAKRNWALRAWKCVADSDLEEVVEYGFLL